MKTLEGLAREILLDRTTFNEVEVAYSCTDQKQIEKRIVKALKQVREQTLLEAEKIAEDYKDTDGSSNWKTATRIAGTNIAQAIRTLREKEGA